MNLNFNRTAPAALALLALLAGCKPDLADDPKSSAGSADFSRYIAVGNSLTSGYGDSGLYLEGQLNSYPSMLANQFKAVGGGEFVQPLFPAANANGTGYLKLNGFDATGNPQIVQVQQNAVIGQGAGGIPLLVKYSGTDNQNLGVPGIRVSDVTTPEYGTNNTATPHAFNSYFERLLPAGSQASYLQYVQERVGVIQPTFFTDWLGNNDVLGYAASGGSDSLTSISEFTTKYGQVLDALTRNGAKGLVATIPNVATIPLFTTVPTAAVIAQVRGTAVPAPLIAQLTAGLGLVPAQVSTIRFGFFIETRNPSTGATVVREATPADLVPLSSRSAIGVIAAPSPLPAGFGVFIGGLVPAQVAGLNAVLPPNALPNRLILDAKEVSYAQGRTIQFNNAIVGAANARGLALFDGNAFFGRIVANGLVTNGVSNSASFIAGNLFSLDGVHPTPRGYAVIVNEMIKSINSTYNAAVPGLDPTNYRGVKFP